MRPVKLTMVAFGPYADKTEIDFDALGTSGVYLVCGDTGAGKTMVFDAICFALFGEASGDAKGGARSTTSLRSDYATGSSKTYVELEFEYRGKRYRVKRNPEYVRAKERGEGETKEKADAELELPSGRVFSGVKSVNKEIVTLLGIDSGQFKQIVMLAQGEFRKLLTADTGTRERIFRKLFGTEVYERLQEELADERNKLERENSRVKTQIATLAGQARFAPESTEASEFEEHRPDEALMGAWLAGAVDEALAADRPEYARLEDEIQALRNEWSDKKTLLGKVETRPGLETQRIASLKRLEELSAAAPSLAEAFEKEKGHDGERRACDERAAVIEGTFSKYEQLGAAQKALTAAHAEAATTAKAFEEAEALRQEAENALKKAAEAVAGLEGADVRRAQAQSVCDGAKLKDEQAKKVLQDVLNLSAKEAEAQEAKMRLEKAESALARAQGEAFDAEGALIKAQECFDGLAGAEAEAVRAKVGLEDAERSLDDALGLRKRRVELEDAILHAQGPYEEKVADFKAAEAVLSQDQKVLQDLQIRQRAGRAGLLAADLKDGAPCPVCGSTDHPVPAAASGEIPTDEQIDGAAERVRRSQRVATSISNEAEKLNAILGEKTQMLARFDAEHGGTEGIESAIASAQTSRDAAFEASEAASARQRQAQEAKSWLNTAAAEHKKKQERLERAKADAQGAKERLIAAENTVKPLRAGLGEIDEATARANADEAGQKLAEAEAEFAKAHADAESLELGKKALADATERDGKARERLDASKTAAAKAASREALAAQSVDRLAADLEFGGLDAAKSEAARLRQEAARLWQARNDAEKALNDNAGSINEEQARLEQVDLQLKAMPSIDVDATKHEMEDIQRRGEERNKTAAVIKSRIDANESCLEQLKKALAKEGNIEERYGRVKLLADAATGTLAGAAKVRFEAYVQAIYFDKVIDAANRRLKVLTSGQFELVRYSESSGNAKAGLGLYVIDSFTGRARDASSLSGGESFQASLCLALGLSDIVQAHAGGIEFDTMFVDEGFGSLDQGALGNAISLLSDLSGGTKLVGIISHVEDLKANIPKKIVVTKHSTGSTAAVEM